MITIKNLAVLGMLALFAVPNYLLSAPDTVTPRIIGGDEVTEGTWPSAVALVNSGTGTLFDRHFCGGNVIASQWILTAAHCLHDQRGDVVKANDLKVALGVTDLDDPQSATEILVTTIFVHPDYDHLDSRAYNDIALLELAQPTLQPIMTLFDGDIESLTGTEVIVAGWGSTVYSEANPSLTAYPNVMNQVSVPLVSRADCNVPDSYNGDIVPGQFCAGFREGGKDSCLGDSGGPLMIRVKEGYQQAGVVSFGRGCALEDLYGIYADVAFYRTWIGELIGGLDDTPPPARTDNTIQGRGFIDGRDSCASMGAVFLLILVSILGMRVRIDRWTGTPT